MPVPSALLRHGCRACLRSGVRKAAERLTWGTSWTVRLAASSKIVRHHRPPRLRKSHPSLPGLVQGEPCICFGSDTQSCNPHSCVGHSEAPQHVQWMARSFTRKLWDRLCDCGCLCVLLAASESVLQQQHFPSHSVCLIAPIRSSLPNSIWILCCQKQGTTYIMVYHNTYVFTEVTLDGVSLGERGNPAGNPGSIQRWRAQCYSLASSPATSCSFGWELQRASCHAYLSRWCVCVCHVMKFYHSTVDIPWGLVRTFCEEEPQVIDYNVAANPNQSWFLSHGNERFRFSWKWKTYRAPVLVGLRHDPGSHFKTASIQFMLSLAIELCARY